MPLTPRAAMVFAAGYGKRMQPLTLRTPKPLLNVNGKPIIEYALEKLLKFGVERIVVNSHHLSEQIEAFVKSHPKYPITISHEDILLETGGGLVKALPHLYDGKEPIFVINGDIIWTDTKTPLLETLASSWNESKMDALLALIDCNKAFGYEGKGDFDINPLGDILRTNNEVHAAVFTGIQIMHPRMLAGRTAEPFSLGECFRARISQPSGKLERIKGFTMDGRWFHIGTPQHLEQVQSLIS